MAQIKIPKRIYMVKFSLSKKEFRFTSKEDAERKIRDTPTSHGRHTIKRINAKSDLKQLLNRRKRR